MSEKPTNDPTAADTQKMTDFEHDMLHVAASYTNDWLLEFFIRLTKKGIGIPVTLTVGGCMISGLIISGKEYLESVGDALGQAVNVPEDERSNPMAPFIEAHYPGDDMYPDGGSIGYIHLKNARTFLTQDVLPTQFKGNLWRGRLSSVDGFTLGELGPPLT